MEHRDATAEEKSARRRMQNRVAQRNHRERCQRKASSQPSKRSSNVLVWTQPRTIPQSPDKLDESKPERESKPKAKSQKTSRVQRQPTPQWSPSPPSSDHQLHDQTSGTSNDNQPINESNIDPWLSMPDMAAPEYIAQPHLAANVTHDPLLGAETSFDQISDMMQLKQLLSPPGSTTSLSVQDDLGAFVSAYDSITALPPAPLAAGAVGGGTNPDVVLPSNEWLRTEEMHDGDLNDNENHQHHQHHHLLQQQSQLLQANSHPHLEEGDEGVDHGDLRGYNALHLAARRGQTNIVRLLLSKRPRDTNAVTDNGQSALHLAAAGLHQESVTLLMDQGADALLQDELGQTALHIAVTTGAHTVAQILADRSQQSLASRDMAGCTPLHAAIMMGNEDMVQMLLDKGADPASVVI